MTTTSNARVRRGTGHDRPRHEEGRAVTPAEFRRQVVAAALAVTLTLLAIAAVGIWATPDWVWPL